MSAILVPTGLLTGVAEMDGQHDRLFHEIQQVKDALLAATDCQGDELAMLSRLAEALDQHFLWEEESARTHDIPFADHAREHARIGAFIRAKINELNNGECNIPALMVFMDRCFETHVVHHDLKLGRDLLAAQALE